VRVALILVAALGAALFFSRDLDTRARWRSASRAAKARVAAERNRVAKASQGPRGKWLSLVYTSNGQGEIEPCG
jgi:hypothetical protein